MSKRVRDSHLAIPALPVPVPDPIFPVLPIPTISIVDALLPEMHHSICTFLDILSLREFKRVCKKLDASVQSFFVDKVRRAYVARVRHLQTYAGHVPTTLDVFHEVGHELSCSRWTALALCKSSAYRPARDHVSFLAWLKLHPHCATETKPASHVFRATSDLVERFRAGDDDEPFDLMRIVSEVAGRFGLNAALYFTRQWVTFALDNAFRSTTVEGAIEMVEFVPYIYSDFSLIQNMASDHNSVKLIIFSLLPGFDAQYRALLQAADHRAVHDVLKWLFTTNGRFSETISIPYLRTTRPTSAARLKYLMDFVVDSNYVPSIFNFLENPFCWQRGLLLNPARMLDAHQNRNYDDMNDKIPATCDIALLRSLVDFTQPYDATTPWPYFHFDPLGLLWYRFAKCAPGSTDYEVFIRPMIAAVYDNHSPVRRAPLKASKVRTVLSTKLPTAFLYNAMRELVPLIVFAYRETGLAKAFVTSRTHTPVNFNLGTVTSLLRTKWRDLCHEFNLVH